jgi:hypothetical protein
MAMENAKDGNLKDNDTARLKAALKELERIKDALIQVNAINGNVARYADMK